MSEKQMTEDASTMWLRHTDENGDTFVREHRVWDRAGFLSKQHAEAAKVGGKSKVEQITEQVYKQERVK